MFKGVLRKVFKYFILSAVISNYLIISAQAQDRHEVFEGQISAITEERNIELNGQTQLYQKLEVSIKKGSLKGETVEIENGLLHVVKQTVYRQGDRVLLDFTDMQDGNKQWYIIDFVRRDKLYILFGIFILIAVVVGKFRGIQSILGMLISFVIIFTVILPQLLAGRSPVIVSLIGALFLVPVTFYLSHGFSRKTTIAMVGTYLSLIITVVLAQLFISLSKLTGFSSEDALFLQNITGGEVNVSGLLLAGIIIGAVGILDDITISQASVVFALREAARDISVSDLYTKAMKVGQDHISSMVNTLVLVYTGGFLPLLLLFMDNSTTFAEVINYEMVAEEIVRTLVGSIGLILAVPLTTFLACFVMGGKKGD